MGKIKVFECYAGYGGASFALQKAGIPYECVGYSEYDKRQIRIYEQNHKGIKNYNDITKINPHELPDFDLITGGFPCQDVSLAGLRDLSKGRTNTVFKMLEIIKVKKPKYCLLENVQGLLSMLDGELIKEIVRQLKGLGYAVSYKLLKSKDYGTPQNRPRVWIAAELKRNHFMFNPFPIKEELKLFVSDLLEDSVDIKYYLTKDQFDYSKQYLKKRNGQDIKNNINRDYGMTILARHPKRSPHESNLIEIVIHSKQPRTNTSGKGGSGPLSRKDNIAYTLDTTNSQYIELEKKRRILTPKECFRLQGFFQDEININNLSDGALYFSAGNGWDINLVSQIFQRWLK